MNRTIALLAGCVLVPASLAAQAQSSDPRLRMDTGFYLGAGMGRSEARDFCTTLGGACDDKDMSWNVFAGYQFTRNWAVEVGYNDFGHAKTTGFVGGFATNVRMQTKAAELVAVGLLPLGDHFALYGKAGGFYYESDGTATGGVAASTTDTGWHLTFGLGAQYDFNGRFATRIEWQRYLEISSGLLDNADISVVRVTGRYKF